MPRYHVYRRTIFLNVNHLGYKGRGTRQTYHGRIGARLVKRPDFNLCVAGPNSTCQGRMPRRSSGRSDGDETRDRQFQHLITTFDNSPDFHVVAEKLHFFDESSLGDVEIFRDLGRDMRGIPVGRLASGKNNERVFATPFKTKFFNQRRNSVSGRERVRTTQFSVRKKHGAVISHGKRFLQGLLEARRPHGNHDQLRVRRVFF
ncbi:MAG: hypothetical protein BWY44_00965 [Candidatus Omnitrophica bacterium ADurb.Bin292]|nr:MAG: hypothetical protein BWY44_00965 [Candidatus Omnitrophica bacterium ADurb.Bin292]